MRFAFINLKKASIYDVREWLRENINLTEYQKQKLMELDIRDTNLCFYKKNQKDYFSSAQTYHHLYSYCVSSPCTWNTYQLFANRILGL